LGGFFRGSLYYARRESAKSMLMEMQSGGPRGPQSMKMRYTHLGACRDRQGAVSFDKNSEQCRKMQAQAAKMDPARPCARAGAQREDCEQRTRENREADDGDVRLAVCYASRPRPRQFPVARIHINLCVVRPEICEIWIWVLFSTAKLSARLSGNVV
jgi:hypothetical protein